MGYLLDTNIITAHLKRDRTVAAKLREVGSLGEEVCISGIGYYEVKRGLLYSNATRKLSAFDRFCQEVTLVFPNL